MRSSLWINPNIPNHRRDKGKVTNVTYVIMWQSDLHNSESIIELSITVCHINVISVNILITA